MMMMILWPMLVALAEAEAPHIIGVDVYAHSQLTKETPMCADIGELTTIMIPEGLDATSIAFIARHTGDAPSSLKAQYNLRGTTVEGTKVLGKLQNKWVPYTYPGDKGGRFTKYLKRHKLHYGDYKMRVKFQFQPWDLNFNFNIIQADVPEITCCTRITKDTPCTAPTTSPTTVPSSGPSMGPTPGPSTSGPSPLPTPMPTPLPSPNPSTLPTTSPTASPTTVPSPVPTQTPTSQPTPVPSIWNEIDLIYIIEDNDKTKLNLDPGHHHMIFESGVQVEEEVWFHGLEQYNIVVEVGPAVRKLVLDGYYYRLGPLDLIEYDEPLALYEKTYYDVDDASWYPFLNGTEERTSKTTDVPPWRRSPGFILLEAGEYHLLATPYDEFDNQGAMVNVTVDIRGNPQREPIFDEGLILDVTEWKDFRLWQLKLRKQKPPPEDEILDRERLNDWRLNQVTGFLDYIYVVHESWGVIFKINKSSVGKTSGMEIFLDVNEAMLNYGNTSLDISTIKHSGVRSVAFHPDGTNSDGRLYIAAMENAPDPSEQPSMPYIETITTGWHQVQPAESVIVEFIYKNGMGCQETYRLILRVQVQIIDHTIRQMVFGPDKHLYVLHGDGSVESSVVGNAQRLDGLGKVYRIDPMNGTTDLSDENVLARGEYSTEGNPWDFTDEPRPSPAFPGPIDRNAADPWANVLSGPTPKETYAIGFRNPHSISFTKDGHMIVGEAGRDTYEEINVVVKGGNYGWSYYEGTWFHEDTLDSNTRRLFYSARPITRPEDECNICNFRWPAVELGHNGYEGMGFNRFALVGGHPVENGSPIAQGGGKYFFTDFPNRGNFYYSYVDDLIATENTNPGPLADHVMAPMFKVGFKFKGKIYANFRQVLGKVKNTPFNEDNLAARIDIRIGRDDDGTLYIHSKALGKIFKVTNTVPP